LSKHSSSTSSISLFLDNVKSCISLNMNGIKITSDVL
jgi:hypothetical protein